MKALYALITLTFFMLTMNACERTSQPVPGAGELLKVELAELKSIPGDYGDLTAVTTHAAYEGWAQLWFEDEEKTIRMVRVQFHDNRVHEDVLVIPRD
jgi:hypothetical protein